MKISIHKNGSSVKNKKGNILLDSPIVRIEWKKIKCIE